MSKFDDSQNVDNKITHEIKTEFIAFLRNREISPEILRQATDTLKNEKPELFQKLNSDDAFSEDKSEWVLSGYFDKQVYFCEKNFSIERIDHVIAVKSHCIEQGIAGFSSTTQHLSDSERKNTVNPFNNIDLKGYIPSPALQKHTDSGDLSNIRNALFMELNDKRISTVQIRQAIAWVLKKKNNLFVPHEVNANARAMNMDTSQWDRDYYGMQEVFASSNFSQERLSHMVEVRAKVFNVAKNNTTSVSSVPQQTQQRSSGSHHTTQSHSGSPQQAANDNNWIKYALIIGGAIAALATLIISSIR